MSEYGDEVLSSITQDLDPLIHTHHPHVDQNESLCMMCDLQMMEEESCDGEEHDGRIASDVFREEVLKILRQPFDKEEYKKYREAIKVGSYLDHHQDVKRKLKTFQRKQGKCLSILRGFFYWLQNLTREGAFEPWTDRQCLAVEPPPVA